MIKNLACVLLFFVLHTTFAQNASLQTQLIPDNLKENANSCIRFQSVYVEIKSQKKYKVTTQKTITVFNKFGNSNIDAREYFDNSNPVNAIEATIYNSLGKVLKKLRRSDFKDVSVSEGFTVSDRRLLFMEYTPTEYPFTVVYESEVESSNTAFLPRWYPIDDFFESVQKSTFSISYPPDLGFKFKEEHFENKSITKLELPNKIEYSIENVVGEKPEEASSTFKNVVPKVWFALEKFSLEGVEGSAKTWQDFGLWMENSLLTNTDELSEETKLKIKNLVANETDVYKKAKLIYQYMQSKTRYVSIQMGIGGWKPMLAKDVDRLGYGDCKALSNYTRALLKSADIASYYTIINGDRNRKDIDEDFVAMQGNHAILTLPINDKMYFLECTSQTLPFAHEGDFTDDRKALIVTPDGGKIIRTQVFSENASTLISTGTFAIDDKGAVKAQLQMVSKGIQYDNFSSLDVESATDVDTYFKAHFSWINNLKLEKSKLINDKEAVVYSCNLNFSVSDYGKFSQNLLIFPINLFNQDNNIPQRYRNRKNYIEIERGFKDVDDIEISIPEGFALDAKPDNFSIKEKFGEYSFEITTLSAIKLHYKRTLTIKKGLWEKSEYENYRTFKEQIAKADNSKIALIKK